MITVTNNSPQAINTSLFNMEEMIGELDKKAMSAISEMNSSCKWDTDKGYIKLPNGLLLQWVVINDPAGGGYENVELPQSYTKVDTYVCFRQVNRDTAAEDQWAKSSMAVPYDVNHVRIFREPAATSKGCLFTIGY